MSDRRSVGRLARTARAEVEYPAATIGRRGIDWTRTLTYPNDNLVELSTLVARSRRAVCSDPYAGGIVRTIVADTVGWGIEPQSLAEDRAARNSIEAAWREWTETSDPWGQQDSFAAQQWLICWTWLVSGEVFVRLRRRLPTDPTVLQLEVLEPEFVPRNWNQLLPGAPPGNRVRAGIEFDRLGSVAAYYMYRSRPGDLQDIDVSQLVRVPAKVGGSPLVLHVYRQDRPGQLRGTPALAPVLLKLRDLDVFTDGVLVRQGLANLLTASLTRAATTGLDPITGEAGGETDPADARTVVRLGVGAMNELAPGEKLEYNDPPDPPAEYDAYVKNVLRAAGTGAGVPYEVLTNDWSGSNDRLARVVLQGHRRNIQAVQFNVMVKRLCAPVYQEWLRASVEAGVLPLSDFASRPERYRAANWSPQAWPYLNPVQDVAATKDAVRSGLTSRSAAVAETGERAEVIDRQQQDDNERADEAGLSYDSDGRKPSAGPKDPGATPKEPGAEPEPAPSPRKQRPGFPPGREE